MSDGLENVVAAETVLSEVDGLAGRLVIRGRSLDDLAGSATFEDVVHLLFDGFYEDLPADVGPMLAAARVEVFREVASLDAGSVKLFPTELALDDLLQTDVPNPDVTFLGFTLDDVRTAIAAANVRQAKGGFDAAAKATAPAKH